MEEQMALEGAEGGAAPAKRRRARKEGEPVERDEHPRCACCGAGIWNPDTMRAGICQPCYEERDDLARKLLPVLITEGLSIDDPSAGARFAVEWANAVMLACKAPIEEPTRLEGEVQP